MAEITKIDDKQEYEIIDFGEQKVKLHMGGKSTAEFAQNLNMRFDCHSGSEKFFINVNRGSNGFINEVVAERVA